MVYHKSPEYVHCIFKISKKIFEKAKRTNDKRLQGISVAIINYAKKIINETNIKHNEISESIENIDMKPFFEYVSVNEIQFLDFKNLQITDLDLSKDSDIEKFILSHIYYITQV